MCKFGYNMYVVTKHPPNIYIDTFLHTKVQKSLTLLQNAPLNTVRHTSSQECETNSSCCFINKMYIIMIINIILPF